MKGFKLLLPCITGLMLIGWASKDENNVNFSGTLTPQDGNPITVENITINNKTKIEAYQKPTQSPAQSDKVIILEHEPNDSLKIERNLSDIETLTVPNPDVDWIYQEQKENNSTTDETIKSRKKFIKKYTEVIIDNSHYLMRKNTTIRATNKSNKNKEEITIAKISRVKELKIKSFDIATKEGVTKTCTVSS